VEIGPHIITGVWPVVLTSEEGIELYYPLAQKSTMQLIRDIVVKSDIVAMEVSTGQRPYKVTFSRYVHTQEERIFMDAFYPKEEWLKRSYETLVTLISAIEKSYIWGNCHACRTCPLRNKCTG
jgi:hypothetical protein